MRILDDPIQNEEKLLEILKLAEEAAIDSRELFLMAAEHNKKLKNRHKK